MSAFGYVELAALAILLVNGNAVILSSGTALGVPKSTPILELPQTIPHPPLEGTVESPFSER